MYQLKKLKSLLLLLCIAVTAKAQLSDGKVYNFVNVGKGASMSIKAVDGANVVATDQSNYSQLWYAASENGGFTLRNLANGYYLQSPNAISSAWTMVKVKDENCIFTATSVGGNYAIRVTGNSGGYNYMHADGGGNIVCWESSNTNSQWTMNVVDIDAATLNANWNTLSNIDPSPETAATYQTALDNLFSDKACTTLKKSFANENAVKNDADYNVLPSTLQEMVLKVYNDSWAEENFDANKSNWNAEYAKKYRVQYYEPYNEPECAASALGLNAHTNLNNPTGIFSGDREAIYVMVEGAVETGASLYLSSYTGNGKLGGYRDGYELKQGLNIIPAYGAGNNFCINYVVHTFDTSKGKGNKAKAYKLSEFSDLKIHIEGGYINGYWNKMGDYRKTGSDVLYTPDDDSDWQYLEERATQTTVTVLGEYITLQFPLLDKDAVEENGTQRKGLASYYNDQVSITASIQEWDNVMLWERFLLGVATKETTTGAKNVKSPYSESNHVVEYTGDDGDDFAADYGDHYNVHGLSYGIPNSYMYGSWDHCGYNYNTMQSIIVDMLESAGSHWGPGHEIGHQHQGIFNMRGLTEVTNNLFSNVVLWYFGETTSRVNGSEGSLSNVLAAYNTEGSDFFTNNIWAQTHMYYKMFLYYHVLGHNPKFYPRLFEMLRQDPMNIRYEQSGAESLLHFYKKCCYASGEDLTEFFRAYGFFRVMTDRFVGDYSNAVYNQTQAEIDAAIKEIKDWATANPNVKENIAVLFINDATGETIKSHKGDNLSLYGETTICAEVGSYATFNNPTNATGYECSLSGNTATMNGNGGVGFAIFNEKGEIIAFSDKSEFTVSAECAAAIAQGEVIMQTVNADNTTEEVELDDEAAAKYGLLGMLLEEVADWLELIDNTGTKVGYYLPEAFTELQDVYNEANTKYTNKESGSYSAAYTTLLEAFNELKSNTYDRINIIDSYAYRLENKRSSGKSMAVNDSGDVTASDNDASDTKQQWIFEPTDEAGVYLVKNKNVGGYLGELEEGKQIKLITKKDDAKGYMLISVGPGIWALQCQTGNKKSLNYNSERGVIGWHHNGDDGSYWYITAAETDDKIEKLHKLQILVTKTEELIDEIGYANKVKLQGTNENAEFYLYCNALYNKTAGNNNGDNSMNTEKLLDDDPATYLHTDYRNGTNYVADDNLDHYLRVDMGAKNKISQFQFTYTTRNAGNAEAHPKKIVVEGCNSLTQEEFTEIMTLPRQGDAALPGANTNNDGSGVYTSPQIECQPYRYIRFMVTETQGTGKSYDGHPYFYMAEFNLITEEVIQVDEEYKNTISEDFLREVYTAVMDAKDVLVAESIGDDYTAAFNALTTKYDDLLGKRNTADNAVLEVFRGQLATLINSTESLLSECGTVKVVQGGALILSMTPGDDVNYLTAGPNSTPSEGALSNLIDNDSGTSFTSNWGSQTGNPYLQVQLPNGQELGKFIFTFTARQGGGAPTPSIIVVGGSNDGQDFTPIATFTKEEHGFPAAASGGKWTSPEITDATAYKYLRFTVTKSERTNPGAEAPNGYYHFGISHFGVSAVGRTEVTLLPTAGGATKEDVLAAYNQNAEAQAVHDMATTKAQLQKAIEKLTAAKEALEIAQNASRDYNVTVVGGNSQGGVVYGGVNHVGGSTFSAPVTLEVGDLTAISLDGYELKSITLNGTNITVIYNKVYTVKVTGGKGNGGITYGGKDYADGTTFAAEQGSFSVNDLTVIVPDGYTLKETITLNHETGVINVVFSAIPLVDTEKYYTFECLSREAHKTERFIRDNGTVINGHSAEGSLFRFEAADDDNGYYIKSYVTDKYINHTTDGSNTVYASGEKNTIWTMAVPSHTPAAHTLTVGNNLYLNNNGSDCTDKSCTNLQSLDHTQQGGAPGSGNACSLWTITEGTPLDMTDLKNLIDATNNLIISCYQNGNIDGELVYFNSVYVTADVMTDIKTAVANAQAKYDAGRATTQGEYNTALTALQTANTTLASNISLAQTEASDRLTSREALREKIEALGDVVAKCGVVEWGRYPTERIAVSLTEANLSTNAQETSEGPIENLLKDDETFFHSSWKASVGAAHYIQVDLGEGKTLQEFVFGYTTRNVGPHPYIVVVSGSNSPDGDFEDIKVFNSSLPKTGSTSWEAPAPIKAEEPYRYLRFTVTKSSNLRSYGEYCFAMSKFGLKTITYSENEDYYVESLSPNGSVTEEQLLSAYRTMVEADELDNEYTTKSDLDAMIETLTTLGNDLESALNTLQLPVELTTDVQNPVLYTFKSQRGETKALQYEPVANHMLSIAEASEGNVKQMFYFTMGDTRTQVYVHPFVAGEQVLAASDLSDGKEKVFAAEMSSTEAMPMQWTFEKDDEWYSLNGVEAPYFSNYGGGSNKMGFYGSKDEGSRFQFTDVDETTVEGSAAYHSLNVYYTEAAKVASSEIVGGSNPYYYPEVEAVAYNKAYAAATDALASATSTDEEYTNAYNALKTANEALVLNMPEVGKYYTIASACSDHRGGQLMYATGENAMVFSREMTGVKPEALWTFTNEGYLENLQTGCSVSTASTGGAKHKLGESPKKVDIKSISIDGQVLLTPNGGQPLHAQDNGSVVVGWGAYDAGSASAWRIVEVEDMSLVNFALTISKFEHAGLYLNYPVTIPDGVKAYYLDGKKITIDNGVGSLNLTKIEENVIPANTAVILYAPQENYKFEYADEPNYKYEDNLFTGSSYQTYREAEANHYYYVFGQNNGEIGLYKNGVKYNATGAEGTTHYKMSANKILFDWDGSVSNVSSFRFRLGTGGQTTSLEDALMMDNTIIYDLYGRRILEVNSSGLYIVNGEKRYIQVK